MCGCVTLYTFLSPYRHRHNFPPDISRRQGVLPWLQYQLPDLHSKTEFKKYDKRFDGILVAESIVINILNSCNLSGSIRGLHICTHEAKYYPQKCYYLHKHSLT